MIVFNGDVGYITTPEVAGLLSDIIYWTIGLLVALITGIAVIIVLVYKDTKNMEESKINNTLEPTSYTPVFVISRKLQRNFYLSFVPIIYLFYYANLPTLLHSAVEIPAILIYVAGLSSIPDGSPKKEYLKVLVLYAIYVFMCMVIFRYLRDFSQNYINDRLLTISL